VRLAARGECVLDAIDETLIHFEQPFARPGAERIIRLSIAWRFAALRRRARHGTRLTGIDGDQAS